MMVGQLDEDHDDGYISKIVVGSLFTFQYPIFIFPPIIVTIASILQLDPCFTTCPFVQFPLVCIRVLVTFPPFVFSLVFSLVSSFVSVSNK